MFLRALKTIIISSLMCLSNGFSVLVTNQSSADSFLNSTLYLRKRSNDLKYTNISWTLDKTYVDFSIESHVDGWISLGFPKDENVMVNSDCVIGYLNSIGQLEWKAYYLLSYNSFDINTQNEKYAGFVTDVKTSYIDGLMTLSFRRELESRGKYGNDILISSNGLTPIIWATNSYPPNNEWYHDNWGSLIINLKDGSKSDSSSNEKKLYLFLIFLVIPAGFLCLTGCINKLTKYPIFSKRTNFFTLKVGQIAIFAYFIIWSIAFFLISVLYEKISSLSVTGQIGLFYLSYVSIPATKTDLFVIFYSTSYERMLLFHKFFSVMFLLISLSHGFLAIQKYSISILLSSVETTLSLPLYGTLAVICSCIISLFSTNYIRRQLFEVFKISHFLFVLVFVFTILHCKSLGIYVLILPVIFLIPTLTYRLKFVVRNRYRITRSSIISDNVGQIRFRTTAQEMEKIIGGKYVFICIPKISYLQWHPYSVCRIDNQQKSFSIYIKNNGDWTNKVLLHLKSKEPLQTCFVDSSYGEFEINPYQNENLVFIAGGIGITSILSSSIFIANETFFVPTNKVKNIAFIWVLNDENLYLHFKDEITTLESYNSSELSIQVQIYFTADKLPIATFVSGRPNFEEVLNQYSEKKAGIFVCGPVSLQDDVRYLSTKLNLDLHMETFYF